MTVKKNILFSILISLSLSVFSYDAIGHRIIADIAYKNLNHKTRCKVDKILGKRGLIYTSTWADEVRSDKKYDYSYAWHYQNLKDSMSTDMLENLYSNPQLEGDHLFYAIDLMTNRLKKDNKDSEALKFLIHFMADLHQPMHLGRFSDLGGNRVKIQWFGKEINLHSLWDTYMLEAKKMNYSEYSEYLQDTFDPQKKKIQKHTIINSIEKGYEVRNKIYEYDMKSNNYVYIYQFNSDLDELLYLGGMQLANLLNIIYHK